MQKSSYITLLLIITSFGMFAQVYQNSNQVLVKGHVKDMENRRPIANVEVSTNEGEFTTTDFLGFYKIKVSIGDELIFSSIDIETKRYTVTSGEDVDVLIKGYSDVSKGSVSRSSLGKKLNMHQVYLDSADLYKKKDIEKSIDFITQSIAQLGKRANKTELAKSLTQLGDVYQFHQQYDLAITNYKDALVAYKTTKTTLKLSAAYIFNKEYKNAEERLLPLIKIKGLVPFQRVDLYERLGDANKGLGLINKAVAYYTEGLVIAKKNQITPKLTDLNSKIADAYASDNRLVEAEGYYGNSLELATQQAPQRALQEKEKVADFYNKKGDYKNEIQLRKNSLDAVKKIGKPVVETKNKSTTPDTITAQRINYKIGNAYVVQNKFDEAIPYLERSIVEANSEDDLVVQKDATRKLSEIYGYKGEYTKALEELQNYVALVDTLYDRKEQEISRAARFNREITTKQNRISGLEQERELSQSKYDLAVTGEELVKQNNKIQKWVIYSLIFGLILMGLAAFFFYRSNQQQKLANNLLALKSLRSQMNPHFIFNALNSVNNYIAKSDERSANRYLSEFSTLMRSVLENSDEDFIPLTKEVELLELYVKLEHSRFADKFDYTIQVDENLDVQAFQIPPMLLQPYIENAIWHGLRYKEEKGFLKIDMQQVDKETLQIIITDDGIGRKKSAALKTQNQKKQKSKGMGNIKKRVAILNDMYKNKVGVHISDLETDGSGTKVKFTLKRD